MSCSPFVATHEPIEVHQPATRLAQGSGALLSTQAAAVRGTVGQRPGSVRLFESSGKRRRSRKSELNRDQANVEIARAEKFCRLVNAEFP